MSAVDVLAVMAHEPTICEKRVGSQELNKTNWSHEYVCPVCGESRRQSANFLGNGGRTVNCYGDRMDTGVLLFRDVMAWREQHA